MRIEVNLETGKITKHKDAPITWVEPIVVAPIPPTKEQLLVELELLTNKIQAL